MAGRSSPGRTSPIVASFNIWIMANERSDRCEAGLFRQIAPAVNVASAARDDPGKLGGAQFMLQLIHPALPGRLVRAPAEQAGAVAEAVAGHLIVEYFDHQLGLERLPLGRSRGGPSAGAA